MYVTRLRKFLIMMVANERDSVDKSKVRRQFLMALCESAFEPYKFN